MHRVHGGALGSAGPDAPSSRRADPLAIPRVVEDATVHRELRHAEVQVHASLPNDLAASSGPAAGEGDEAIQRHGVGVDLDRLSE
jgi:hypothetical protein